MAPKGERDEVLQGVCSTIAWMRPFRETDPSLLAKVFLPTFELWANEPDATKNIEDELEKATSKIERSQEDYQDKLEDEREELKGIERALLRNKEVYAEDAEEENEEVPLSVIRHAAIIQKGPYYYLWDFKKQDYCSACVWDEMSPTLRESWASAPPLNFQYQTYNREGNKVLLPKQALLDSFATRVSRVVADWSIQKSCLDIEENTFYEAVAPIRDLEPTYDERFDEYLRALVGKAYYEKVQDWLAGLTMLDHQQCALYLNGPKGIGKSLLASSLGRLWRKNGDPTSIDGVIGGYNSDILGCPLLHLDEGVPPGANKEISVFLRRYLGSGGYTISTKYMPNREAKGCGRLIVTANNAHALDFQMEELTANDMSAVASRFLYIETNAAGGEWLEKHNKSKALTSEWLRDGIAKHVLYLRKTRELDTSQRFLVEGDVSAMNMNSVFSAENGGVLEWIVRFASNPFKADQILQANHDVGKLSIGDGAIQLNAQAILDVWGTYMQGDRMRPPTVKQLGRYLGMVSEGSGRTRANGKQFRYHKIDTTLVLEWAKRYQVGDEEKIKENIARTF